MATNEKYSAYNNIPKSELWDMLQDERQKNEALKETVKNLNKKVDELDRYSLSQDEVLKENDEQIERLYDNNKAIQDFFIDLINNLIRR